MMVLHAMVKLEEDQVFVWRGMVQITHSSIWKIKCVYSPVRRIIPWYPSPHYCPIWLCASTLSAVCTLYIVQIPTEYERFLLHRKLWKLWKRCSALEHFDFLSTIFILHQTARADILQLLSPFSTMFTSVNYNQPVYFSQL